MDPLIMSHAVMVERLYRTTSKLLLVAAECGFHAHFDRPPLGLPSLQPDCRGWVQA